MRDRLKEAGVLGKTALVAADPEAPLGEQYATLCTALAIGGRCARYSLFSCSPTCHILVVE
jgi:hypothetical protein